MKNATYAATTRGKKRTITVITGHGHASTKSRREAISASMTVRAARAVQMFQSLDAAIQNADAENSEIFLAQLRQEMQGLGYFVQEACATMERDEPHVDSFPVVEVVDSEDQPNS